MIKVIFWDFDGVILDSMPVRDIGFRKIFEKHPIELVDELIIYHRNNGGLSRFHKIKYFYNNLLNEDISEKVINDYANKFSIIMKEELTKRKYLITQTVEFIKNNHKKYLFHIVSGSEQNELRFLCEKHNLSQYFNTIEGSPTPKNDLVKNRLYTEKYDKKECILIGDSMNDYTAANINDIVFYGFNNEELKDKEEYIYNFKEFYLKDIK